MSEDRQNENLQRLVNAINEAQESQMVNQNIEDEISEDVIGDGIEDTIGDETQLDDSDNEESLDEESFDEDGVSQMAIGINPDMANNQLLIALVTGYVGKASDYLEVINVIKNLDTQKIRITLRHMSAVCDREVTVELGSLKKTSLFTTLTSKGIVVYEWCCGTLSEYLIEQVDGLIQQRKIVYQHEQLGWSDALDKTKGFFASNSIGAPYASIIRGNDDGKLGPHGDRAIYDGMINSEIIPNKSLHLPFVLAFTGPIVPLMYGKSACPVLMTNFAGKSSQGKTTSLALMASIWGRGIVDNDRLSVIKTFASTQNGFEAAVNSNNGVPVLFDDYEAASQGLTFGSLIYTLAQGESKIRCDKYGHAKDTHQWRTTIALTGESSIFDRAGHNLGLKPRIVEFKNKAWTVSKANSINITSVVGEHYGFYGEEFVAGLIPMSKEELDQYYDDSNKVIESKLPSKDNISDRIQTRLVLIRMTAELVRKILDLDIDVDYITDFLVNNELARQSSIDVYEEAKEKLVEYITSNLYRFVRTDKMFEETMLPNANIVGRIYNGRQGYVVLLMDDPFKSILSHFNDREAIMEHWRDEGFLITRKDRNGFQKKGRICSQAPSGYYYTFLFEDADGSLKKYLEEAEEISLQGLVDDDREYLLNHKSEEAPTYTYHNGRKYMLIDDGKPKEIRGRFPHDLSNVSHSSPKDDSQEKTPEISTPEYDDTEAVNEIFDAKEEDDND